MLFSLLSRSEPRLCRMKAHNISEALKIEKESFDTPWNRRDFCRVLNLPRISSVMSCVGSTVAGFIVYQLEDDFICIFNMAVSLDYRRQGIGRHMIERLINKKREVIICQVSERNLLAQIFFREMGFRVVKIEREVWPDTDAYWFRRWLKYTD